MGMDLHRLSVTEGKSDNLAQLLAISTTGGKQLATIGIVDKKVTKRFGIDNAVYYADIVWGQALRELGKHKISFSEIAKFPEVRRDLALLIDKKTTFAEIEQIAYATEKRLLRNVNLFDVYEGKNLEAGKKSYAVNFTLQDTERTLTDRQIEQIMQRLIAAYEQKLGAKLR